MRMLTIISPDKEIRIVDSSIVSVETTGNSAIRINCIDGTVYKVFTKEMTEFDAMNILLINGTLHSKLVDIQRRM